MLLLCKLSPSQIWQEPRMPDKLPHLRQLLPRTLRSTHADLVVLQLGKSDMRR
jgi:hypothetical protein